MKKIILVSLSLILLGSFAANAESLVRIQCEDEDNGTEVYLNGKFVGECPVDAPVAEGSVKLSARRLIGPDHERLFEKSLVVVDGVSQRVEIVLSAPQLTAPAKLKKQASEAALNLRAAEAGDIDAMKKMALRYEKGIGVQKDPAQAEDWYTKAEAAAARAELRAAGSGNIEAMRKIADRYDSGLGVAQDPAQAKAWRSKAIAARREQVAKETETKRAAEALRKEQRMERSGPFKETKKMVKEIKAPATNPVSATALAISSIPFALLSDIIYMPTDLSEMSKIQNEAALRPSRWGKPDSLIAKAAQQLEANGPKTDSTFLIAHAE
jgi:hypothetical protein